MMLRVRYSGVIAKAWRLFEKDDYQAVIQLCTEQLGGAHELAAAHRLRAQVTLEEPGGTLWTVVDRALDHARQAVRLAHWSDPTQPVLEIQAFASQPATALAQRVASARAMKCLERERSREALHILWSAYPEHRGAPVPTVTPVASAFASLAPNGTPGYAFRVAQAMRSNGIAWFNAQSPSSYGEQARLKRDALAITQAAIAWGTYALTVHRRDPSPPPAAEQIASVIEELIAALRRDQRGLA
jgi:hypothetical protein